MSAPRNKAFNQWKNGFIRHYEPLTSVEAFVGGWDSRDAEVAELNAKLTETEKVLEMTTKGIELQNQTLSFLSNKLTESQRLNKVALEAIRLAVRQNSCEMVMTGDEIRKCESAIKELERP